MFGKTFDENDELIIDPSYIDDDVIFITGTKEEPKVDKSDVEKQIFGEDENESKEGKSFRRADWHDKIVDIKLPQKEIDKFMSEIDCVVVNTYENDDYHLSDEERAKNNELYELFKPIIHAKNNYTVLSDFVDVMRACIKCVDYIAETNGVYSPEKFKKKVYSGKIKIEGLRFPKLSKKAKKRISLEYLTEFILSDEPSENIIPPEREFDTIRSEEEIEEMTHRLFTDEELKEIFKPLTEEQKIRSQLFDATTDEQADDLPTCVVFDEKKSMKVLKDFPEINLYLKRVNARSKRKGRFNSREWEFNNTFDDLDVFDKYDETHAYTPKSKMPEFKGELLNDKDYKKYLMELEEWEDENIKEVYTGTFGRVGLKMLTRGEIKELELKEYFEANGWNTRNLYDEKEKIKEAKKADKKDRAHKAKIARKIKKLKDEEERINARRKGEEVDEDIKKKNKKKGGKKKGKSKELEFKKKGKKGKKVKNKKKKSSNKKNKLSFEEKQDKKMRKRAKRFGEEAIEAVENAILKDKDKTYKDFEEYEKDIQNASWF